MSRSPTPRTPRNAVFLDRDGVLNMPLIIDGKPHPPDPSEPLVLLQGAARACRELRAAGYLLIVVTNQPDIARGTLTQEEMETTNLSLRQQLPLDDVIVCPHDDADQCGCRKPAPGLLLRGAELFDIDLSRSLIVGDRWRDIEAGRRAGCGTIFVDRGYRERRPDSPDLTVGELEDAVPWILDHHQPITGDRNRHD